MDKIVNEMRRLSVYILGVCEVRWCCAGKVVSNGVMFLHSGRTDDKHMH